MLAIRLFAIGLLAIGLTTATPVSANPQLYQGSWVTFSFGNEVTGGTGESEFVGGFGIPAGLLCNPGQPRCPIDSTPVSTPGGDFAPLGGRQVGPALYCTPLSLYRDGITVRPAKGETPVDAKGRPIPPLYRNPFFFTPGGAPDTFQCTDRSTTIGGPGAVQAGTPPTLGGAPGLVQVGNPLTGSGAARMTTANPISKAGFDLIRASAGGAGQGIRFTGLGSFTNKYPYVYSYSYATLRNSTGTFGPGQGPGSFNVPFTVGAGKTVASAIARKGPDQFGGVMRLLGQYVTKVCYYRNGGCSLGEGNWHYELIGQKGYYNATGTLTAPYLRTYTQIYYHTVLFQKSTITVIAARFPWTTGEVTLTAVGRGPHKTLHYAQGYDNRGTDGKGKIQMVSPILTRWIQPCCKFETGGIATLKFEFVPEPGKWAMLVAGLTGLSLVAVLYRSGRP